jgi:hypothetical protein
MNFLMIAFVALYGCLAVRAEESKSNFQAAARLIEADGSSKPVWIKEAEAGILRFVEDETSSVIHEIGIKDVASVYFLEPGDYAQAIDLYQARKYEPAKEKFIAIKNHYKPVESLPNNYSTLAAFYEMECLRKLGDLDGVAYVLQGFKKESLTRDHHLRQLEMYIFWEAARTKSWDRLDAMAKEREKERLPGYQRAQVAYCHALALEGLGKPDAALDQYQTAMTADAGSSEDLARQSALSILRIHQNDPRVKQAIQVWGTPQENPSAPGDQRLLEAGAIANLFQLSFGAGVALPEEYRVFLKYHK